MKTTVLNSFLKIYIMMRTEIDLYGIVHVKVDFIPVLKMCVLPILGRFVWTAIFDNVNRQWRQNPKFHTGPTLFEVSISYHTLLNTAYVVKWSFDCPFGR